MSTASKNNDNDKPSRLLSAVRAIAISPEDAKDTVAKLDRKARDKYPDLSAEERQDLVARKIVKRYATMSSVTGGATALVGVVPGLGTVLAAVGGATADAAATLKFQVDMTMCLAEAYGYDLNNEDARNLSLLIAIGGTVSKAGAAKAVDLGTKAAVKLLREHLKKGALIVVKELFKKVGITFTRKALENAIPFGIGVVVGAGANYGLTRWVGGKAIRWFELDREDGGPAVTLGL